VSPEFLSAGLAPEADGSFAGLASVFGSTAHGAKGPTRFSRGAFVETLAVSGGRIPLLWQHDQSRPVGVARATETDRGLEIVGKITTTSSLGADVWALLRDGAVTGLSIGFEVLDSRPMKLSDGSSVRLVSKANLHEVSLVTFPADPKARVSAPAGAAAAVRPNGAEGYFAQAAAAEAALKLIGG
jgi:HK97 family phage prohead protease